MNKSEATPRQEPGGGTPQAGPAPAHPPYYAPGYYDSYGYAAYAGAPPVAGPLGELNLRRIVRVVRRKWLTLLAVTAFALGVGLVYTLVAKKVYRATSLLELSVRRPRIAGQQGAVLDDASAYTFQPEEVFFVTRLEKFKGATMLEETIKRLKGLEDVSSWSDERLRHLLSRNVQMTLVRRSRLVQISFDDSNPEFAAAAANAYAQAAEALAFDENKEASDSAVAWLQAQAQSQRAALEKADQSLVEFRTLNKIDVLESQKKNAEQSIADFNKSLTEIESLKVLASDLNQALQKLALDPEAAGHLPASMPRAAEIQAMLEKWISAISERDALLSKYTREHPAVQAQNKVIEVQRQQAMESIRRGKQTSESNLNLLEQQAASLQKNIELQNKRASELELQIVQKKNELTSLERERDAADISYRGILNRIEEARLSADENTASVKISERAGVPEKPIRPRVKWVLLISLILGLGAGCALMLVLDVLEDTVGGADELEDRLGLKVLAVLPHLEGVPREHIASLSLSNRFSPVAEAMAGVRSLLDTPQYAGLGKSVLVASTAPEEGKTITACNLAIMCAKSGMKTLLVDFDMRRPRISRIFKAPPGAESLAHALQNQESSSFERLPYPTECDLLQVVMSRCSQEISPAELMGGRFVRDFVRWAEGHYDRVIIDSPPFGLINDSAVLAGLVGMVILVCRPHRSRKRAIRHLLRHFQDVGAKVAGVVVNDVSPHKGRLAQYFDAYPGTAEYAQAHERDASETHNGQAPA